MGTLKDPAAQRRGTELADPRREEQILDAMRRLVLRLGYSKVNMQDVADVACVGKGTIYLHWSSKDELLDAVLLRETARLRAELITELHRTPELVVFGSMAAKLYRAAMSDPLLRAYNRGDTAVLGTRAGAPSVPDRLGISLVSILSNPRYVEIMSRHRLVIDDVRSCAGRLAIGAVVAGFVLRADTMGEFEQQNSCGDLLATVLQRTFGLVARPSRAQCQAVMADLLTQPPRWTSGDLLSFTNAPAAR